MKCWVSDIIFVFILTQYKYKSYILFVVLCLSITYDIQCISLSFSHALNVWLRMTTLGCWNESAKPWFWNHRLRAFLEIYKWMSYAEPAFGRSEWSTCFRPLLLSTQFGHKISGFSFCVVVEFHLLKLSVRNLCSILQYNFYFCIFFYVFI